jgi:hypothetical protein
LLLPPSNQTSELQKSVASSATLPRRPDGPGIQGVLPNAASDEEGTLMESTATHEIDLTESNDTPEVDQPASTEQPASDDQPTPRKRRATVRRGGRRERSLLFPADQAETFRYTWMEVQAGFVDEPRQAVRQADSLVSEALQKLATSFADQHAKLEQQWDRGEDVSTEDLRLAVRRYRSFFDHLVSA